MCPMVSVTSLVKSEETQDQGMFLCGMMEEFQSWGNSSQKLSSKSC